MTLSRAVTICLILLALRAGASMALETDSQNETTDGQTLVVSYNATGKTQGVNISELLGADRFYDAGYYGQTTVSVVMDAGLVWNTHAFLIGVDTFYVDNETSSSPSIGNTQNHATAVASLLGGYDTSGSVYNGIAPQTTLQSGAVATTIYANGSFNWTNSSFLHPFLNALAGSPDVINCSWGYSDATGSVTNTLAIDGLVRANPETTFVLAAGNSGQGNNTVLGPASGYNGITVGAVGSTTTNVGIDYTSIASYSSGGPANFYNPDSGETITGVRAVVDIVATGTSLYVATKTSTTSVSPGNGTSYAAPLVAGGVALLKDASYQLGMDGNSRDSRVIKAALMNSADKLTGWDNGQHLVGGVVVTTQSLDWYQGAGMMNLTKAYDQYLSGTTDVAGNGGGTVQKLGWDLGQVEATSDAHNDYLISSALLAGQVLDVTLTWFRNATSPTLSSDTLVTSDEGLANLDLEVWDGNLTTLYATSNSTYNSSEELHYTLTSNGTYLIRVVYEDQVYGTASSEYYGLDWSVVPEPAVIAALAGMALTGVIFWRRRKRSKSAQQQPEPYFSSE